jgi:hypothetical protein
MCTTTFAANAFGIAPNNVNCNTTLPNGQTVGSVVRQQRAILQNAFNDAAAQAQTGQPSNPLGYELGAFTAIVGPNGPIDFKKGQTGQTFVQMGLAGNFAYYAIGAGFFSDSAAAQMRGPGLAANGCSIP